MTRFLSAFAACLLMTTPLLAAPSKVEVVPVKDADGFRLLVDGQPFFIKGAGGGGPKDALKAAGANAFRTWGLDHIDRDLAEAEKHGLKVVVGIWLGHERHGFSYSDADKVAAQYAKATAAIAKYKDHPAILAWGIGNEMEGYKEGNDPAVWKAVQDIAAFAKKEDSNHPTMTVIAEVGGERVKSIHELAPAVDIVGINTYAGAVSIPQRYRAAGGIKPYVLTEFGPPGTWEVQKTKWGAAPEPTSTQKAEAYRRSYEAAVLAERDRLCLGSFAFTWGAKQEATATWFGMFLPDGSRVAAVDTMQELWTGKPPANRVPTIQPLKLETTEVAKGAVLNVKLDAADPESDPLTAEWTLAEETPVYGVGGDVEPAPATVEGAIRRADTKGAEVKMPNHPGRYRLFVVVRDNHGGAATANVPLLIPGQTAKERLAPSARLPLILHGERQTGTAPYAASGWMGKIDAIALDEQSRDNPKAGDTCIRAEFRAPDNFGGVVWQDPANDWGDQPGGHDLTGATRLAFWARGAAGGETVEFKLGVIEKTESRPHFDTASAATTVTLTKDWKRYELPLAGKDLRRIKTGFAWVVVGQGKPVTFYLDEIRYE